MKIFCLDYADLKISHWHQSYWAEQGHEVKTGMYHDVDAIKWADVSIYFWCEGAAGELSRLSHDDYPGRRVIQIVDIDAYAGHYNGVNWLNINHVVYMSKHIQDMVNTSLSANKDYRAVPQQHQISLGIDLDKWTYKDRGEGYNVGFLAAEWWSSKNPGMVVQVMAKLVHDYPDKPWRFFWSGVFNPNERWLYEYVQNQVDMLNLRGRVTINFAREDSIDEWMEQLDYFITCGQKDSYSLIVGEAMAKGIKTMAHNFWGADKIWGKYVWKSLDDLSKEIGEGKYDSAEYRNYIAEYHNIEYVLKQWDDIITT